MRETLATITTTRNFYCTACGLAQLASIRSVGYAVGHGASEHAREDAERGASMLLALTPCPRCGAYDRARAAQNRRTRVIALVAMAVILGATTIVILMIPGVPLVYPLLGCVLLAIAGVWANTVLRLRYPERSGDQVTLTDPPPVATHDVPPDIAAATRADGGWKWM